MRKTGNFNPNERKTMIKYNEVKKGDILKISEEGAGAPGYAEKGELIRVIDVFHNGIKVENKHGGPCEFLYNCGAKRLETTEWKEDFPGEA